MAEEIVIDNTSYKLYSFTGKVVDQNQRSETHVSGGGSYYSGGYLHVNPVSTTVNNEKEFFLVDGNGQESHFRLKNISLPPMRVGHTVQVKWLIRENYERGPYVIFHNKTLGKYTINEDKVGDAMYAKEKEIISRWYPVIKLIGALGLFAILCTIVSFLSDDKFSVTILYFVVAVVLMTITIKVLAFIKKLDNNVREMKKELANWV